MTHTTAYNNTQQKKRSHYVTPDNIMVSKMLYKTHKPHLYVNQRPNCTNQHLMYTNKCPCEAWCLGVGVLSVVEGPHAADSENLLPPPLLLPSLLLL